MTNKKNTFLYLLIFIIKDIPLLRRILRIRVGTPSRIDILFYVQLITRVQVQRN